MSLREKVIDHLVSTYDPTAIILYGSYADGSNSAGSDFDALVITDRPCRRHDESMVEEVQLDVFIYSTDECTGEVDCEKFLGAYDGNVVLDKAGIGAALKDRVVNYLDHLPRRDEEEIRTQVAWCEKMLLRTRRGDAEGFFRWHWVLVDSLEIYCGLRGWRYFGPKKSIQKIEKEDPTAAALYARALADFSQEALEAWVTFLREQLGTI